MHAPVQAVCDRYQAVSSRSSTAFFTALVAVMTVAPAVMSLINQVLHAA